MFIVESKQRLRSSMKKELPFIQLRWENLQNESKLTGHFMNSVLTNKQIQPISAVI